MKSLVVYWAEGRWFGSEINWKRSGSGFHRETSPLEVPQSRAEIEQFARENHYAIEYRGAIPVEARPAPTA